MENRIGTTFPILWAIAVCLSVSPAVDGAYISFSRDAVIQDGDNYDGVFVYGDDTTVEVEGGSIGKLLSHDRSTVNVRGGRVASAQSCDQSTINISGGHVTSARSCDQSTINISGGTVRIPKAEDIGSTINVTGGTFWNVEVGGGKFIMSAGKIVGMGIFATSSYGAVTIFGYGFEFMSDTLPRENDGRLTGFWQDGTPFGIDFRPGAYQLVILHEVFPDSAPIANAGKDQTVVTGTGGFVEVVLDGSASSDPDGDKLLCEWTWIINTETYKAQGANPTIMLPAGRHIIELVVNDGQAHSKPDYVVIEVLTLIQQIDRIRDEKVRLLDRIDIMLAKEQQVIYELNLVLGSGDYGLLTHDDIIRARQAIHSVRQQQQQQIKQDLEKCIENLKDALRALEPSVEL